MRAVVAVAVVGLAAGCSGGASVGSEGAGVRAGAARAVSLAVGTAFSCALLQGGSVRCWGANEYGEQGNGTFEGSTVPRSPIGFASGATGLSAGTHTVCARAAAGDVRCWGHGGLGQLGDDSSDYRSPYPRTVADAGRGTLAQGGTAVCTHGADGLLCWGNHYGLPYPLESVGTPVKAMALSEEAFFALLGDGRVQSWGSNFEGALGEKGPDRWAARDVALPRPAVSIAAGYTGACAALDDGTVSCWGRLMGGDVKLPTPVRGLSDAKSVAVGLSHACAIAGDGGVRCWGENGDGQLGDGTKEHSVTPVAAKLAGKAVALASQAFHTCAILETGAVQCWGWNEDGQCGDAGRRTVREPVTVRF